MERDIAKLCKEYGKIKKSKQFTANEYQQIKEIATLPSGKVDLFTAIDTSLCFAYMLGYKTGKRERKKKKA